MLTQVTYLWPYMDYALSSIMHGGNMVITLMGCQHIHSNAAMMMTKVDARQTMDSKAGTINTGKSNLQL